MNERRKPTGAKIELRMRVRFPITSVEHVTVSEKWFYVDKFDASVPKPQEEAKPAKRTTQVESKEEVVEKPAAKVATPEKVPVKPVAQEKPGPEPAKKVASPAPAPAVASEPPKKPEQKVATTTPTKAPAAPHHEEEEEEEDPNRLLFLDERHMRRKQLKST